MSTAILAELVKLFRSAIGRLAAVLLAFAVPAMAAGFVAAAQSGGSSQLALKVRPLVHGQGWDALTSTTGQVTSIAMLLGVGFVVSWTFGREFTEGAIETLLMARPSRATLASAKLIGVLAWASITSVASASATLGFGALLGLTTGTPWPGLGRTLVGAVLTALLALPFALVATVGRSALGGVGAVIGIIVITQILTVIGVGPWFPYAAPSLWLGMGGPDLTASTAQLLLVLPLAGLGWTLTVLWWQHAELTSN